LKTGPSVSIADFRGEKAFIEDRDISVGPEAWRCPTGC
jgi:hypothetical protein